MIKKGGKVSYVKAKRNKFDSNMLNSTSCDIIRLLQYQDAMERTCGLTNPHTCEQIGWANCWRTRENVCACSTYLLYLVSHSTRNFSSSSFD